MARRHVFRPLLCGDAQRPTASVLVHASILVLAVGLLGGASATADSYRIDTYAGGGTTTDGSVGDGLPAVRGVLDRPSGLARGPRGLFIADHDGGRVRRVRSV